MQRYNEIMQELEQMTETRQQIITGPGRYRMRDGGIAIVIETHRSGYSPEQIHWAQGHYDNELRGRNCGWSAYGNFNSQPDYERNIVEYLGPLETPRLDFTLEVGRRYNMRNGGIMRVTHVDSDTSEHYQITGDYRDPDETEDDWHEDYGWSLDGRFDLDVDEDARDIVSVAEARSERFRAVLSEGPTARARQLGWITPKGFLAFREDGTDHPGPEWRRAPWLDQPEVAR